MSQTWLINSNLENSDNILRILLLLHIIFYGMFGISLTSKQIYVQAKQSMDIDTFLFIIILNIKGQLFKQSLASVQQNCVLSHMLLS